MGEREEGEGERVSEQGQEGARKREGKRAKRSS